MLFDMYIYIHVPIIFPNKQNMRGYMVVFFLSFGIFLMYFLNVFSCPHHI